MAGRFEGQHAVMTGGATGIGAAVLAKLQELEDQEYATSLTPAFSIT